MSALSIVFCIMSLFYNLYRNVFGVHRRSLWSFSSKEHLLFHAVNTSFLVEAKKKNDVFMSLQMEMSCRSPPPIQRGDVMCLSYYGNNKQNIKLILIIIFIIFLLTWRCSSLSSRKMYTLYAFKKPASCTESQLFCVNINCQIHTRLCKNDNDKNETCGSCIIMVTLFIAGNLKS